VSSIHALIDILDQQITGVESDLESVTWTSDESEKYQRISEQCQHIKTYLALYADLEAAARMLALCRGAWPNWREARLIRAIEALDACKLVQGVQA
jgi:hypothetical protein